MSKDFKVRLKEIKIKYKKVDDEFLNLFEKRYIIFIENGVDLKSDCKLFDPDFVKKGWDHQEKMIKIDIFVNSFLILILLLATFRFD